MIRQISSRTASQTLAGCLLSALLLLTGCNPSDNLRNGSSPVGSGSGSGSGFGRGSAVGTITSAPENEKATASQEAILRAQDAHSRKVELTVAAYVRKILKDDREGLPHERFLIDLNNGSTVLVAHDIAMAPYVPLHKGDFVMIHGEYIWNERGGVLHWTHHTDTPRHEGGWIDYDGKRYQ